MFSVSIASWPAGSALETWLLYCQILSSLLQVLKAEVNLLGF